MTEKMRTYFTVVLDCGSTGSRVNVFEWMIGNGSRVYGNLPVLLRSYPDNVNKSSGCQYHCMQTEPGLHNFVNDAVGVRASLEPLIRYAEQWVPLERRAATPIFVLATAGMRRLVAEEAKRVLGDVENVVKEHGFLYRKSWVRVLSGKEEAYYGWVALNYKMGIFGKSSRASTLGLLDLGGSSLQVVAEVDASMKDENVFRSKIGPVEHDIVAYSLPAFGLNEAFDRTTALLSHTQALGESAGGIFEVRHPCLGSGFVQNYTCRGCFGIDSRVNINMSNQVQGSELNSVFLVGEPNWEQCKVIARAAAINSSSSEWSHQLNHSKCIGLFSYGGTTKLNLTKTLHTVPRYHALSGFFAVYHALNLSQRANLSMLWESGEKLCSGSWADQKSSNGQYCFRVPYLTSLIENALCLSDIEIIFGPGDVSWTLGASLIEGEFLWLDPEKSQNPMLTLKDYIMIPSPVLIFVLLLSLLLIVYCCQIKLPMPGRKIAGTRTSLPSYLCPKRQLN
ncbi:UNVERIFIED_CONTAM: putative apyrase 7 [Sesamum calycinum]|uniref:Apyrase 7 n=1 Tax=Sesamum calycinum TaxID=2727403 RepID=A0AAW2NCI6_9LAMI